MWCLKGVEGVLVGDVNKKPEIQKTNNSLAGAEVMLEAEGWVMVNKSQQQIQILKGFKSFWRLNGGGAG